MRQVVIIGNGIAGITAARRIRQLTDDDITVISGESDHFYSRTALMYIYMGHMRYEDTKPYEDHFWEKNRIRLKRAWVSQVNPEQKTLRFSDNTTLSYDVLIIATGSQPRKLHWPGCELTGVQGLYSLQDLELMETNTKEIRQAVVIGGGLIGIEMAEMLHSRKIHVTFLVRESSFWNNVLPSEESTMITQHIREQGIDLRLGVEVEKFTGNRNLKSVITKTGEEIPCAFAGITIGVQPNISFLEGSGIQTKEGVLVDDYLSTNIPDIYAIGDCAEHRTPISHRKAIEQIWYTGRIMGETVAETICGHPKKYEPGPWFNSAKFFNIEYQVYGRVPATPQCDVSSFFWEDEKNNRILRLTYEPQTFSLKGIQSLGIRLRQEVCKRWVTDSAPLEKVVSEWNDACFDPEFHNKPGMDWIKKLEQETGITFRPGKKSWKRIFKAITHGQA
ncbi:MAG: FAD-dependent oxidoreductase [Flavobacteriales bacterium]|nr:FAD-dependent oxidoreductase [Flavobacteriales bacterium]